MSEKRNKEKRNGGTTAQKKHRAYEQQRRIANNNKSGAVHCLAFMHALTIETAAKKLASGELQRPTKEQIQDYKEQLAFVAKNFSSAELSDREAERKPVYL